MITATFSNGFTDTYKGKRPVKAAWAIILTATGQTLASGHSINAATATKTAEGHFRDVSRAAGRTISSFDRPHSKGGASLRMYWDGLARKAGYKDWKEAYAAYAADVAKARENVTVEVVAI